ncbi:gpi anchored [Diplodia corticola]|uniref:Gpi anchored n=1 Tax=Diplodia corticola TaxID=236234 RepID=A0A1J9R4M8_9PEZI|nr:gpi anchored [Diplodia corticola]OJD35186.1 gpi anchored [Diplodia corticola]
MYKTLPIMFAAGAVAQSTITTSWLAAGFDNTPVASVIAADGDVVTYSIGCSYSDITEGECGIPAAFTVTAGPSILEYHYTDDSVASDYTADFTMAVSCAIDGTTQAVCVESAGGTEANFPGETTETLTGTDVAWGPLIITAGVEKLSASAGASATGSASASTATGAASESGSSAQSGSRTSAGASATGSASSTGNASPFLSSGAYLVLHRHTWRFADTSAAASTASSHSGSATGSAAHASSTGGAARFAVPVAGVAGVLVAAMAL